MARKGLGKGLDSLIPNFYDEDFDSNSPQSLEDMLKDNEEEVEETPIEEELVEETPEEEGAVEDNEIEESSQEVKDDDEDDQEEESNSQEKEESNEDGETSEDIPGDQNSQEDIQTSQTIEVKQEHVDEVREIVEKNPRITLWSSKSSAVFRYLRKTEPEFSISKEASVLIEEAVSKKYPEIWALFEDL